MRMHGIPRAEWPEIFDAIRLMEGAALDEIHREQNKGQK